MLVDRVTLALPDVGLSQTAERYLAQRRKGAEKGEDEEREIENKKNFQRQGLGVGMLN
jgi:hypothetical protein